ncbi:MAG: bifunctional methylenetetrahydrofolate dehydrogenase/methenyltetrahydrofolate cyclohydrolase FolD [Verrucomicrobiota bacterium]|nr:bifunctional methylenetetrahydrofolate dehydrogenase/methenyltetrahydrofolate cyclohydrolase FolD [Verrucomicrobiota bacterium]
MNKLIDGKAIAATIHEEVRQEIKRIGGRGPSLAFLLVGDNPASESYVRAKKRACALTGITSILRTFPSSLKEMDLLAEIERLACDPSVDGVLVQLPLPPYIDETRIMCALDPEKDVDGFHPLNMGKLMRGIEGGFIPCTPLGIRELLLRSNIEISGKHALIIGRSNIVGKPLAALLMQKREGGNATVTVAHSHSQNLSSIARSADLLIAAVGKKGFVTAEMVKKGAVVIDVGIHHSSEGICGDVDFAGVAPLASHITPVPGGVGPMTIAMLLKNTLLSYKRRVMIHPDEKT